MPYLFCAPKTSFDLGPLFRKNTLLIWNSQQRTGKCFKIGLSAWSSKNKLKKPRRIMALALTPLSNMGGKGFIKNDMVLNIRLLLILAPAQLLYLR